MMRGFGVAFSITTDSPLHQVFVICLLSCLVTALETLIAGLRGRTTFLFFIVLISLLAKQSQGSHYTVYYTRALRDSRRRTNF